MRSREELHEEVKQAFCVAETGRKIANDCAEHSLKSGSFSRELIERSRKLIQRSYARLSKTSTDTGGMVP